MRIITQKKILPPKLPLSLLRQAIRLVEPIQISSLVYLELVLANHLLLSLHRDFLFVVFQSFLRAFTHLYNFAWLFFHYPQPNLKFSWVCYGVFFCLAGFKFVLYRAQSFQGRAAFLCSSCSPQLPWKKS